MGKGRLVTVLGFIDPHETDVSGKVRCVSISAEGRRYVILPRGKGRVLTALVDTEAQVSGIVREIDGVSYLDVLSFEGVCYDLPEDDGALRLHIGHRGGGLSV